jgi:hypothetical protein
LLDDERHRSVVHQLHRHARAERSGRGTQARGTYALDESLVERLGPGRRRRLVERRATSAIEPRGQRELRDDQLEREKTL